MPRHLIAVPALLVVVAALSGCQTQAVADMQMAGDGSAFFNYEDDVAVGQPVLLGGMPLCLTGAEQGALAEVTAVRPAAPSGPLELRSFAVVRHEPDPAATDVFTGSERRALPDDSTAAPVVQRCDGPQNLLPSDGPVAELLLEFRRTAEGEASTEGVVVEYRSGERTGRFTLPLELKLCPGKSGTDGCAPA